MMLLLLPPLWGMAVTLFPAGASCGGPRAQGCTHVGGVKTQVIMNYGWKARKQEIGARADMQTWCKGPGDPALGQSAPRRLAGQMFHLVRSSTTRPVRTTSRPPLAQTPTPPPEPRQPLQPETTQGCARAELPLRQVGGTSPRGRQPHDVQVFSHPEIFADDCSPIRLKLDDGDMSSPSSQHAPPSPPNCPNNPNRHPYMGFAELLSRDNDEPGRSHRRPSTSSQALNFTDEEGRHIHLLYNVVHHDAPVLGLDHEEECIESVVCTSLSAVTVYFCNAVDASSAVVEFQGSGLLAGGAHWGCADNKDEPPNIILRKTHSAHRVAGDSRAVVFRTSAAGYTDFFQSAKIRFGTNMFYPAHEIVHSESQHAEIDAPSETKTQTTTVEMHSTIGAKDKTTGFSSWLANTWSKVKHIGQTVANLVKLAYKVGKVLASGDLHCDYRKSIRAWGVNYNATTRGAKNRSISIFSTPYLTLDLENTFVRLAPDVVLELDITSYILKNLKVAAEGDLTGNIAAIAKTSRAFSFRHNKTVATYSVPPIWLQIGPVPVSLEFTIPVNAGYQVDVDATVSLRSAAMVSARVAFGVQGQCTSFTSCKFHQLSDYSFQHTASLPKPRIDFRASLQVHILPTVVLKVYKIAGPSMGVQIGLETAIALPSSANYCPHKGVHISANVNIDVSIGARVDVGFPSNSKWPGYHEQFGPWGIYSKKMSIWSGCIASPVNLSTSAGSAQLGEAPSLHNGLFPGATYVGTTRKTNSTNPACTAVRDSVDVSLQVISYNHASQSYEFALSQNYGANDTSKPFGCTVQTGYKSSVVVEGAQLNLVPLGTDSGLVETIHYHNCTVNAPTPLEPENLISTRGLECESGNNSKCTIAGFFGQHKCSTITLTMTSSMHNTIVPDSPDAPKKSTLLSPTVIGVGIACGIAVLLCCCVLCRSAGMTDRQKRCRRACCPCVRPVDTTDYSLNSPLTQTDEKNCRRRLALTACLILIVAILAGTCYVILSGRQHHPGVAMTPNHTTVSAEIEHGLRYIGAQCNSISGAGCNPSQLPMAAVISSVFNPSLLLRVNAPDVTADLDSYTESESGAQVDKTASLASQASSDSFGIRVPNKGVLFSDSSQHKSLVKDMHADGKTKFYGEVSRSRIAFTVTLNQPVELELNPKFASAIEALPAHVTTPDDENQWIKFYEKYGTHYVKTVVFGGTKRLTTFIDSDVQKDGSLNEGDWSSALQAKFDLAFDVRSTNNISKKKVHSFDAYCDQSQKFSVGGDHHIDNWKYWTATVDKNPSVIRTLLGPISELIDNGEKAETAVGTLQAYFGVCPNTPDNGICNGYGSCDVANKTCHCPSASGSYHDDDGNCYLSCPQNCSRHGSCSKGKCQCKTIDVHGSNSRRTVKFGYKGRACEKKCGIGHWSTDSSFTNPDGNKIDQSQMDCFCGQKIPGLPVGRGMLIGYCNQGDCTTFQLSASTYGCNKGGHKICGPPGCDGLDHVSCKFGDGVPCEVGPDMPLA